MIDKKIYLVGFMGSGKSTVAKRLASQLGISFRDTDEMIEKNSGFSISQIFRLKGENHFRELEAALFRDIAADQQLEIIATGGGFPCFNDLMNQMNEKGITIYLRCSPETVAERIKNETANRPLLQSENRKDSVSVIRKKMEERIPVYEQAQIIIDANEKPEIVVGKIIKSLG